VVPAAKIATDAPESEYYAQLFGVRRSIRYHRARRAHFSNWVRRVGWISALLSTGAAIAILRSLPDWAPATLNALIAAASLMSLYGKWQDRSEEHHDAQSKFVDLDAKYASKPWTMQRLEQLRIERGQVEKHEREPLQVQDSICHNDEARAEGCRPEHFVEISTPQRILAPYMDFRPWNLKRKDHASSEPVHVHAS
jgi:hypothetical protein